MTTVYSSGISVLAIFFLLACGGEISVDDGSRANNGAGNNGADNNGVVNNGVVNNGATNNGGANNAATNNGSTNNGTTPQNNGTVPPLPTDNPCASGPLDLPIANCRPAVLPSVGDNKEDCVRRINQLRWECQCLPPLERWTEGEACADQQALYDSQGNGPHAGFAERICSPGGFGQNECPNWGSWDRAIGGCLQQMWDEGPGEPFIEHGHYLNMTNSSFSRVACGEGDGWFVQNFN